MSAKQAINDKLQGSVAAYLTCDGVVNNQIKKGLLLSVRVQKLKSVNIWQSYKQQRGCLMHFARLANTLLKDEESARDNHVYACNFAKYSPILFFFTHRLSNKPFLIWLLTTHHTLNMHLHYLLICRLGLVLLTSMFHKVV